MRSIAAGGPPVVAPEALPAGGGRRRRGRWHPFGIFLCFWVVVPLFCIGLSIRFAKILSHFQKIMYFFSSHRVTWLSHQVTWPSHRVTWETLNHWAPYQSLSSFFTFPLTKPYYTKVYLEPLFLVPNEHAKMEGLSF